MSEEFRDRSGDTPARREAEGMTDARLAEIENRATRVGFTEWTTHGLLAEVHRLRRASPPAENLPTRSDAASDERQRRTALVVEAATRLVQRLHDDQSCGAVPAPVPEYAAARDALWALRDCAVDPPSALPTAQDAPTRSSETLDERPAIQVVTAIIRDARGAVLVQRRPPGKEYAGLWETPGGKVEPTDTSLEAALLRELREELGAAFKIMGRGPVTRVRDMSRAYDLHAFWALPDDEPITAMHGQEWRWVAPWDLPSVPLLPHDHELLYNLAAEYIAAATDDEVLAHVDGEPATIAARVRQVLRVAADRASRSSPSSATAPDPALVALQRLSEAATPGKWRAVKAVGGWGSVWASVDRTMLGVLDHQAGPRIDTLANADLIAAAVNYVRAQLGSLRSGDAPAGRASTPEARGGEGFAGLPQHLQATSGTADA